LVGSNFATNWGTVAFFGPLSVHPDLWDGATGMRLVEAVMESFGNWGTADLRGADLIQADQRGIHARNRISTAG
jgi:hypothetical protein